ncbi:MAG: hypothetical protein HW387_1717 [Parachlamydiales bacterium]|nr:hypothetical protein [Parachlamydiales bacterium]
MILPFYYQLLTKLSLPGFRFALRTLFCFFYRLFTDLAQPVLHEITHAHDNEVFHGHPHQRRHRFQALVIVCQQVDRKPRDFAWHFFSHIIIHLHNVSAAAKRALDCL